MTTVGELIPQTSIPMAAYNTRESVKKGNYEEAFQHALTPVLTGAVSKGVNLGLKASEKAIDTTGKALKNTDNYVTIQNALRTGKLRFGEPTTYRGIHQSIIDSYPKIKIDNRFVGEIPFYSAPKTSVKSIQMEEPIAKTIFRANVYKGGEIVDPYNSFFTTDPEYAAQFGPVKQYIIEGKNPSVAKEPLMGYRDPATMDMFVYRNIDNPESTIIIGKDAVTKDIPYQSKGIEVLSYGKNNIKPVQKPKEITLDKAINISNSKPKYLGEFTEGSYISPKTSYTSIFMEEPTMSSSKGLTEAEKLGIPKSLRSDPRALEDPYYWGYEQ